MILNRKKTWVSRYYTPTGIDKRQNAKKYLWSQQLKTVQPPGINNMEVAGWLLARTKLIMEHKFLTFPYFLERL